MRKGDSDKAKSNLMTKEIVDNKAKYMARRSVNQSTSPRLPTIIYPNKVKSTITRYNFLQALDIYIFASVSLYEESFIESRRGKAQVRALRAMQVKFSFRIRFSHSLLLRARQPIMEFLGHGSLPPINT